MTSPTDRVGFAGGLPLSPVPPGTTLLVVGGDPVGRDLCLRLLGGGDDEGALVVTTTPAARRALAPCEVEGGRFDLSRLQVVSCVGGPPEDGLPTRVLTVPTFADATAAGSQVAALSDDLGREGASQVRTGVVSLTPFVEAADASSVGRFVDLVAERVGDGFGALLVDPGAVGSAAVETLTQRCDGRLDVRDGEDGPAVHASGMDGQPDGWQPAPLRP